MSRLINADALLEALTSKEIINLRHVIDLITNAPAIEQNDNCSSHPDAPHGFCRDASHTANRYVCECEGWTLASTPAKSLQAHDDEVIEQVITLLKESAWDDGIIDMRVDDLIEDVRKLKGTS